MTNTNHLRIPDIVAKVAHVTLKDTVRVLIAADLVVWYRGISFEDMVTGASDAGLSSARATPENVAACEQAYFGLKEAVKEDAPMKRWMREIENFK